MVAQCAALNNSKAAGPLLDTAVDPEGNDVFWVMAPRPGYEIPFDLGADESIILEGETADAAEVTATFANVDGDEYKMEMCTMTLADDDADGFWDSWTIAEDADAETGTCPTYGGQAGTVGYTEEIDTYVYLTFTNTGENWRLGTYDDLYDTVFNGGVFPWDDNAVSEDNRFMGMKDGAINLSAQYATLFSAIVLFS